MADDAREVQKKEAETPKGIEPTRSRRIYTPDVDIIEGEEEIVVIADMPGVDEKSVDIVLEKMSLKFTGGLTLRYRIATNSPFPSTELVIT
jgi:HSP20 family protein